MKFPTGAGFSSPVSVNIREHSRDAAALPFRGGFDYVPGLPAKTGDLREPPEPWRRWRLDR
jgi:hypothetical protein